MNARRIGNVGVAAVSLLFLSGSNMANASVIFEKEQEIVSTNKRDQGKHAQYEVSIRKDQNKDNFFELRVNGTGNYAQFKNVNWLSQAQLFEKDGLIFVQKTETEVFSAGVKIFGAYKNFDFEQKSAFLKLIDGEGRVVKEERYSIDGPICDDVTLVHLLPFLAQNKDLNNLKYFYLLTNEPKLYRVMVKHRGEETLADVKADKFQLMADLGPLTEVAAKLVPPTFVWYSKNSTDLKQYEGMDSGYKTANIKSFVVQQ